MDPSFPLVEISPESHGVLLDLVYATERNFTGRPIYGEARCLLHRDAEPCLRRAVALATLAGLRLKVFDAYRPTEAQAIFWKHLPDPRYVADIEQGSNHSRGVALDLTLVDGSGRDLDMGTPFDTMADSSHHFHATVPPEAQRNRLWLLGLMAEAGFRRIDTEWWHYELANALAYPLITEGALMCRNP